jgi:hypothetical protein
MGVSGGTRATLTAGTLVGSPWSQEFSHVHIKGPGQLADVIDGDVAFGPFDGANVSAMDIGLVGQSFLRETFLRAKAPEIGRDECATVDRPVELAWPSATPSAPLHVASMKL